MKDYPNIFVGSSQVSNELPVTIVGDSVKISFDIDTEEVIDVTSFKNVNFEKDIILMNNYVVTIPAIILEESFICWNWSITLKS